MKLISLDLLKKLTPKKNLNFICVCCVLCVVCCVHVC